MSEVIEMPEPQPRPRRNLPAVPSQLDIVQAALKTGNVEMYREAIAFAKELKSLAAREAFDNAMADAKAKIPTIKRNREVDSGPGRGPKYRFEDSAEIARTVDPILSECGLNYRYKTTSRPGEPITVTCIISHRDGHREENSLSAGADTGPGRNPIQQVGSTITYLQRYTLKAALGLAVAHDDDGAGSVKTEPKPYTPPPGSISEAQADQLRDALEAAGKDARAFVQWAGIKRIEDLPADRFASCVATINKHRKA